jgi:hypothetical protein
MAQEGDDELGCWRRLRALLLASAPRPAAGRSTHPPFAIGCSEAGGFKIKSRERPSTVRSDASGFSNIGARFFLTWGSMVRAGLDYATLQAGPAAGLG